MARLVDWGLYRYTPHLHRPRESNPRQPYQDPHLHQILSHTLNNRHRVQEYVATLTDYCASIKPEKIEERNTVPSLSRLCFARSRVLMRHVSLIVCFHTLQIITKAQYSTFINGRCQGGIWRFKYPSACSSWCHPAFPRCLHRLMLPL